MHTFLWHARSGAVYCSLLLAAGCGLAGCASVPDLGPLPSLHGSTQLQSTHSLAGNAASWAEPQWWTSYGDAQLNRLMAEALANSPDLAMARARILRAEGYAQQAGASLLPALEMDSSLSRMKQSYNNGVPKALVPPGFNNASRATLDFSYEIDFWGKNRAAVAAATSELAAAQSEAAQSRLLLTSSMAAAYAELARLYAVQDCSAQAVAVRLHSEKLLGDRQQQGLETMASVSQAQSRRAAAEAELTAAGQAIALQRNALAALSGSGPDRGLQIGRPVVALSRLQGLPASVPAELLAHRPDLQAARWRAEAAARRIDVAHAGFYPNVNLTAFVGGQALGSLDLLTRSGSGIAGIGPAIDLPIFRGGQLEGGYRTARSEYDMAVASYNQTLIQALHEVADAITQHHMLAPQLLQRSESLQAAEQAYRVASERYQGGLANYLQVLNAEDSVINARRILVDLQSQRLVQDISLIKALGGGYQAEHS
ncbi:efflux transporter outer membrane subunit [Aquitalea magnusonii]|uniref:efflux transporter outer membrane subunit n=2 Tax=Aquitalea magnusonii TaxID=332411 RepID=UPI001FD3E817|nr:efflux transporter outer membrane subunit [Aquitalea magnusonii]